MNRCLRGCGYWRWWSLWSGRLVAWNMASMVAMFFAGPCKEDVYVNRLVVGWMAVGKWYVCSQGCGEDSGKLCLGEFQMKG